MSAVADAAKPQPPVKDWTLLVYMVSDEPVPPDVDPGDADGLERVVDLDKIVSIEREAIAEAVAGLGVDGNVHVAVQIDYLQPRGIFRWNSADNKVVSLEERDSAANPRVLREFYKWGLGFRARRYALLFWGHSSGPSGLFSDEESVYGPTGRARIETLDLLELGQSVDKLQEQLDAMQVPAAGSDRDAVRRKVTPALEFVMFKDCFQGLLETAYQLRGSPGQRAHAKFMISSQGLMPVAFHPDDPILRPDDSGASPNDATEFTSRSGQIAKAKPLPAWPYDALLACLNGDKTETIVRNLVDTLGVFYSNRENKAEHIDVPMSALNLEAVDTLTGPLTRFSREIVKYRDDPYTSDLIDSAFRRAFRGVVDGDPMLIDVTSLCERLCELGLEELEKAAQEVATCVKKVVIARAPKTKTAFMGVSVYYYPPSPAERSGTSIGLVHGRQYEQLVLNQLTQWHRVALAGTPSALARARYQ